MIIFVDDTTSFTLNSEMNARQNSKLFMMTKALGHSLAQKFISQANQNSSNGHELWQILDARYLNKEQSSYLLQDGLCIAYDELHMNNNETMFDFAHRYDVAYDKLVQNNMDTLTGAWLTLHFIKALNKPSVFASLKTKLHLPDYSKYITTNSKQLCRELETYHAIHVQAYGSTPAPNPNPPSVPPTAATPTPAPVPSPAQLPPATQPPSPTPVTRHQDNSTATTINHGANSSNQLVHTTTTLANGQCRHLLQVWEQLPNSSQSKLVSMSTSNLLKSIGFLKIDCLKANLHKLGKNNFSISKLPRDPKLDPGETATINKAKRYIKQMRAEGHNKSKWKGQTLKCIAVGKCSDSDSILFTTLHPSKHFHVQMGIPSIPSLLPTPISTKNLMPILPSTHKI